MLTGVRTRKLTSSDRELARVLFTLMAEVFEEESGYLSDDYLDLMSAKPQIFSSSRKTPA